MQDNVAETPRIQQLDVLRGFAVLGLPLMNMVAFAMPMAAYLNPMAYGVDDFGHHAAFSILTIFADQKFMGLFTLLFGASVLLLRDRNIQQQRKAGWRHFFRMLTLLVFGGLHFWFIWGGDILTFYAIVGMFIYAFSGLSKNILLALGGLFLVAGLSLAHITGVTPENMGEAGYIQSKNLYQPSEDFIAHTKELYLGTYEQTMQASRQMQDYEEGDVTLEDATPEQKMAAAGVMSAMGLYALLKMSGMIVLGMALFKIGFLQGELDRSIYKKVALICGCGGILISIVSLTINYSSAWDMQVYFEYGMLTKELGSIPTTIAYAAGIILLISYNKFTFLFSMFANVGKMALTNYLVQSVMCMFIFYGIGLGLFGSLSRLELVLVAICIWLIQITYSTLWLKVFKQGPAEWLWRSISSFRLEPLFK